MSPRRNRSLSTAACWTLGITLAGVAATASLAQQPASRAALQATTSRVPTRVAAQDPRMNGYAAQPMTAGAGEVPVRPPYLTLDMVSPYYQEPILPRKLKVNDIVTVVVKENSAYFSEGSVDRRKNGLYDAVLKDWVKLASGLTLKPAEQPDGDPKASGTIQQTYKADSELEMRNRIEFRVAATVVDIRPNGNLVLEAHATFQQDNEIFDTSITGIIRPEDIEANNTVLSEDIAEPKIYRKSRGHVRDGYRRGWMTKVIDTVNPF
jgi:flagellar L-ring protein precursor FlgH